jgi:hypothetical protein
MPARLVSIDHDPPMLLPPDLGEWVPEDHLVDFLMDAAGLLDLSTALSQPPGRRQRAISALDDARVAPLLPCDLAPSAAGVSGGSPTRTSRCGCCARRPIAATTASAPSGLENRALQRKQLSSGARKWPPACLVLRVGEVTLALDGARILANAGRHSAVSHGHAQRQMVLQRGANRRVARQGGCRRQRAAGGRAEGARARSRAGETESLKLRAATAVIQARARERHREEQSRL